VRLNKTENDDSDYINASFIALHPFTNCTLESTSKFIAAQAPLPHTCADWWRMIWQHQISTIVMLTELEECQCTKAHKYWPSDDSQLEYLCVIVTHALTRFHLSNAVTERVFDVRHKVSGETRQIVHYQYHEWPDHCIPETAEHILFIHECILEKHPSSSENSLKVLVHCSAGVGRTGAFLTIHFLLRSLQDKLIEAYDADNSCSQATKCCILGKNCLASRARSANRLAVNVFDVVANLRTQRPGMVTDLSQYTFCYHVIHEWYQQIRNCHCNTWKPSGKLVNSELDPAGRNNVSPSLFLSSFRHFNSHAVCVCVSTRTYPHAFVCACICVRARVLVSVCVCVCVCVYVCVLFLLSFSPSMLATNILSFDPCYQRKAMLRPSFDANILSCTLAWSVVWALLNNPCR